LRALAKSLPVCSVPQDRRSALTALWRGKQLQYTWLRSLQGDHVDFWQVTGDALDFTLDSLGLASPSRHAALMNLYRTLTPFPEVADMLRRLRAAGIVTAILSNGSPDMLADAVRAGGLEGRFDRVLPADAVRRFKTHPGDPASGAPVRNWRHLVLSRFHAAPSARSGHLAFESHGAFPAEG